MAPDHPVKRLLFDHIGGSGGDLAPMISRRDFEGVIKHLVAGCYGAAVGMGDRGESVSVLATGILHYVLTRALLPSQRKVECRGIPVDVVVPDLKTLKADPHRAILLCIPDTQDPAMIGRRLEQLYAIQPNKENVWAVLSSKADLQCKTFVVSQDGGSFSGIVRDIARFVNVRGGGNLRILGARPQTSP